MRSPDSSARAPHRISVYLTNIGFVLADVCRVSGQSVRCASNAKCAVVVVVVVVGYSSGRPIERRLARRHLMADERISRNYCPTPPSLKWRPSTGSGILSTRREPVLDAVKSAGRTRGTRSQNVYSRIVQIPRIKEQFMLLSLCASD